MSEVIEANMTRSNIIDLLNKAADLMEDEAEPNLAWLIRGITDSLDGRQRDEANVPVQYDSAYFLGYNMATDQIVAVHEIMNG